MMMFIFTVPESSVFGQKRPSCFLSVFSSSFSQSTMVRPASPEHVAGRSPSGQSEAAIATIHSEALKSAPALPFRPPIVDAGSSTSNRSNKQGRATVDSEWSWEEVGAPVPAGIREGMSGADTAATAEGQASADEARVDSSCGEGMSSTSASQDSFDSGNAKGTTTDAVCASMEECTEKRSKDDAPMQGQTAPASSMFAQAQAQNLSLAERQRLQREAQQAFLRSKGIAGASGDNNAATKSKGGAGAISPAVREGFVAHRDVSGKIANLKNAVQKKKASNIGAGSASGMAISRTGSNVSAGNDTTIAEQGSTTGTTSAAPTEHGKDDTTSEATSYPPYPAYPQTMVALGYKLGDPRDKKGGTGPTVDDAMSSLLKGARKAGVAVTGGAMVAVGAVLTPLPTPGGILIAGAGLGVLSTEFEGAKKVMDKGRDKLVDLIDSIDDGKKKDAIAEGDDESEGADEGKKPGDSDADADRKECVEDPSEKNDASVSNAGTSSANCSRRTSETSHASTATAPSASTSSFRSGLSRIGKSIRPLLTDDEAPRRAMDELKTKSERRMNEMKSSTQRTYMKMRSHLNTVVDQLALPDNEALGHHDFAASSDAAASSVIADLDAVKAEEAPTAVQDGTSSVPGDEALR